MNSIVLEKFGGFVRVRCLAIIIHEGSILLINHSGLNNSNTYWMPPGGGLEANESITECLYRELVEETGIEALSHTFLTLHEFSSTYLRAVELFFLVEPKNYLSKLGSDPELSKSDQLIIELKWISTHEIMKMEDGLIHPVIKTFAKQLI